MASFSSKSRYNPKVLVGHNPLGWLPSEAFARNCLVLEKLGKIGILVVDDHAGIRDGIAAVVNAQEDMIVLGEAADGEQAIEKFRDLRPDVSLLDWNLPIVQGEEVLITLSAEFPKPRVIVISALSDETCVRRALFLGAQSYLHKDMLRRELLPAIRSVYRGQQYLPEKIANRLKKGC